MTTCCDFVPSAWERSTAARIANDSVTAYCWGANDNGTLGTGGPSTGVPTPVVGGIHFTAISAGSTHSCAVGADGVTYCWWLNDRGQLGTNDVSPRPTPTPVLTTAHFVEVSAGQGRSCGRTTDGSVLCWGAIWEFRQAGLEFTRAQLTPQAVPGAPTLSALSVGVFTTCGIASGAAVCWEANPHGEMGNGTTDGSTTPLPVSGGLMFQAVSNGIVQTCGVTVDGAAYCWGDDSFGELGVSSSALGGRCSSQQLPCSTTPVRVPGWRQFSSISTGLGNHVCGVTTHTNIYCWGLGSLGQLGFGRLLGATSQALRVDILRP